MYQDRFRTQRNGTRTLTRSVLRVPPAAEYEYENAVNWEVSRCRCGGVRREVSQKRDLSSRRVADRVYCLIKILLTLHVRNDFKEWGLIAESANRRE